MVGCSHRRGPLASRIGWSEEKREEVSKSQSLYDRPMKIRHQRGRTITLAYPVARGGTGHKKSSCIDIFQELLMGE